VAGTNLTWDRATSLFMETPAAIAVLRGPEHVYEFVNPLYELLSGRRAADLLGKPGREAMPELVSQGVWDVFDGVFQRDELFLRQEFPAQVARASNGSLELAYFNFVAQPMHGLDGAVDGVLIHAVEVTEQVIARRRAEDLAEQLDVERSRLEISQRVGKIGAYERNLRTGEIIWTAELEALYGYGPGELSVRSEDWLTYVHPDDRDAVLASVDRSREERSPIRVEFRIVRKDGSVAWLRSEGAVEYDARGNPKRIIGINVDITERKLAEENIVFLSEASTVLSSSLDYETTLENVALLAVPRVGDWCAIDMLTPDGTLEAVAVAHQDPEKIEWARELRQRYPVELSSRQGLPEVLRSGTAALYGFISDESLVAAARDARELELMRSLGMTSVMIVPIRSHGKSVGGITFVTTESRRRYAESDLAMAEELASRASLAIDNATLYREAQNALRVRDDFISIASHELKTPITSLKIYAQMLARKADRRGDTDSVQSLNKMENQIDKLTRLVGDLLDVSKIEAGKLDYGSEVFDMVELVREHADLPKSADDTHVVRVVSEGPVYVDADRDRVGQIITNLLSNAVKYSHGASVVEVSITTQESCARVAVRDFGVGIDPQHQSRIFDRFYQVSDPQQRTFPGLGMGLYISREIARHHGGDITVESARDKGSVFTLTLPIAGGMPVEG
jgi:PAS domain S-box-containing protein